MREREREGKGGVRDGGVERESESERMDVHVCVTHDAVVYILWQVGSSRTRFRRSDRF